MTPMKTRDKRLKTYCINDCRNDIQMKIVLMASLRCWCYFE